MQIKQRSQAGFTLLEILLVIVMIAVTSAMIVPSIQISGASVEEESNRLRTVMRFAMEESQLSGVPIQWVGTQYSWYFEYLEQGEENNSWQPYENPPMETYQLPDGIIIQGVEHVSECSLGMNIKLDEPKSDAEPIIGKVCLVPDGTTSQSNVTLVDEDDSSLSEILEVRPGPAGIRLKKKVEGS